jgi:hypothetical protein
VETYIHHVPGRLRVRMPAAKNNPAFAKSLRILLENVPAVSSVATNLITGSVLVHYDVKKTSGTAILNVLRSGKCLPPAPHSLTTVVRHQTSPQPRAAGSALGARVHRRVTQAAVEFLVEKAIEKAALALIAAVV